MCGYNLCSTLKQFQSSNCLLKIIEKDGHYLMKPARSYFLRELSEGEKKAIDKIFREIEQ